MKSAERIDRVTEHMWSAIEYVKREYDITYAEMIGILQIIIMDLYATGRNENE